jgi:hypothetical protein
VSADHAAVLAAVAIATISVHLLVGRGLECTGADFELKHVEMAAIDKTMSITGRAF